MRICKKKPVKVSFFKWKGLTDTNLRELLAWISSFGDNINDVLNIDISSNIKIKTLEGSSYNLPNNYVIIRGVEGEYFPCDLEIFNKTYKVL